MPQNETRLDEVKAVKRKYEAALLALPGVVAVGVGLTAPRGPDKTREPAILISVVELDPTREDLPAELDGVPVIVNATGMLKARKPGP